MPMSLRPSAWILLSVVLYLIALILPALTWHPFGSVQPIGSYIGLVCLGLGWLLMTQAAEGATLFFALAWLGNIAWLISLIALARQKRPPAAILSALAVGLALLVLIPVLTASPVTDSESEYIFGIGPGFVVWLIALATPLAAVAVMSRLLARPPTAAGAS